MSNLLKKGARRHSLLVAGGIAAALSLSACGGGAPAATKPSNAETVLDAAACQRNKDAGKITYISGYGYSASAGQLDVFLAKELGYFDALCLDVEINASGANGQQLVSSGQAQFTALGSASDVMLAAANSKNLTAVATYGSVSPFSIFANEKVASLKDLEGKKLGYFINLTPIASAMLDAAGVDVSKVELIKMTNYDPTVVTRGQVDAIVGYASNQPQTLKAMNLPFKEFLPADLNVKGTYNVMEANTEFLTKHRETASDFMRASLKALDYCLENDADCLDRISKLAADNNQGSAFPREQLERTWNVESTWVKSDPGAEPRSADRRPVGLGVRTGEEVRKGRQRSARHRHDGHDPGRGPLQGRQAHLAGQEGRVVSLAPGTSEHAGVQISNVSKSFGAVGSKTLVLDDVSITIKKGEFVSVIGPSGCGKSTLLKMIAGLGEADSGDVLVDGTSIKAATKNKMIGLVPQSPALLPWRTVLDNVTLPMSVNRKANAGRTLRDPKEILDSFGLGHALHKYPSQLSGGMQQRVAIARAFVFDPSVLLMDEPFSALDEMNRDQQRLGLLDFWQSNRKTVLFVTHSVPEAIMLSDRIIVMQAHPGRIAEVIDVDLPRPRDAQVYATDEFRDLEGRVRSTLHNVMEVARV